MHMNEIGNRSRPILLFLHGGGVSSWMWEAQVSHFADDYLCIVPDLPGHGESREQRFSIRSCADELLAYLEKQHGDKDVTVIGFSLGSQVALQMVAQNSRRISRVMLNSASVHPLPMMQKVITPMMYASYPLVKWRTFSKLQAKMLHIGEVQFERYFADAKQTTAETLSQVMRENLSFAFPEKAQDSQLLKGFITIGAKENRLIKKSAKTLSARFPQFESLIVADVGHGLPLANPLLFNQALEKLLNH